MKSFLIMIWALFTSPALADIYDPSEQHWQVDGTIAAVLAESPDLFPELDVSQYLGAEELNVDATVCHLSVLRPGYLGEPQTHADNILACVLVHNDGSEGALTLNLTQVRFSAWGNAPSERHWQRGNLPKPFQILFTSGFDQDINMRLAAAMERRRQAGDQTISSNYLCGPHGVLCTGWVSLDVKTDDPYPASHLVCSVDTEGPAIYKTRCVFMFPKQ